MRTPRLIPAAFALLVALAACSNGPSKSVSDVSPSPVLTTNPSSAAPLATATSGATPTRSASRSAAATHSATMAATHSPTPTPTRHTTATPSPSHSAGCTGTPKVTTIDETAGDRFVPATVTINRCDAVKAANTDATGTHHTWQGNGWNSGDQGPGTSFTYRFASTGTFNFYCAYHQSAGMTGTVTVQ